MKQIPDNTLAYFERLPQTHLISMGGVNSQVVGKNIRLLRANWLQHEGKAIEVSPDNEAIQFYLFNHYAALVREKFTRHEPLPAWAEAVMHEYRDILVEQGERMSAYMMLITARESRHMGIKDSQWWKTNIMEPFGEKCYSFHQMIRGKGSDVAAQRFMDGAPAIPVGLFFKAIEFMFFNGSFGGGYGGPPWGEITKCLVQFLDGKITQEMMIDTAYTLAHNNGPMFNKGMLYSHYTSMFRHILDVQRSGQIPEWVIEKGDAALTESQRKTHALVMEAFGHEFGSYVDWHKVKAAGALSSCEAFILQQDKKYGKPKEKPAAPITFMGKPAKKVGMFEIAPALAVPIIERLHGKETV